MPTKRLHSRFLSKLSPALAAGVCSFLASVGLLGQIFNIAMMKVLIAGYPGMSISTATGLLLLSLGLVVGSVNSLSHVARKWTMAISALFVVIVAVINFSANLLHVNRESLLSFFGLPLDNKILYISSPYTAACLFLLALSIILQNRDIDEHKVRYGQNLAICVLTILFFVALGYLFSISIFFRIDAEIGMALHTWLSLLILSIGMINLNRTIGFPAFYYGKGMGSEMLRQILPVFGLVIIVIAFIGAKYVSAIFLETNAYAMVVALTFIAAIRALWYTAAKLNTLEKELVVEHDKFLELFEGNPDAIIVFDAQGRVVEVNQQAIKLAGYTRDHLIGMMAEQFVAPSLRQQHEKQRAEFATAPHARQMGSGLSISLLCADGTECPVDISIRPALIGDKQVIILSVRNQTEIKRLKEKIEALDHDVYHDALTSLPNRRMIAGQLHQIINQAERRKSKVAICYCDLDGFKSVNDSFGHQTGDALLIEAASRMSACIRGEDVVARLGGDEFVIILSEINDRQGAITVIKKLIDKIAQPFQLEGKTCNVTASVGISLYPDHGLEPDDLISKADAAMYTSKQNGKNQASFSAQ